MKAFHGLKLTTDYSWSQISVLLKTAKGVFIFFIINLYYSIEQYGIFILLTSLPSSLALFDFGIGRFVFALLSKNKKEGTEKLGRLILLNGLFSILISTVYICFNYILLNEKISSFNTFLVPLFAISFVISQDKVIISSLRGFGFFNRRDKWIIVIEIIHGLIIVTSLLYELPIVYISIIFLTKNIASYVFDYWLLFTATKFRFQLRNLSEDDIRLIKGYGIDSVVSFFSAQTDKFLIPSLLNIEMLGIYTFSMKGVNLAKSFISILIERSSLSLLSEDTYDRSRYLKESIISVFGIVSFYYIAIMIFNDYFDAEPRLGLVIVATITLLINALISVEYRSAFQTDEQRFVVKLNIVGVAINLLVSIGLSQYFGVHAFVLGSLCQAILIFFNKSRLDAIFSVK